MVHAGGEVEVRYAKAGDQEQQGMSQEDKQYKKHLQNTWQASLVRQCLNSQRRLRHIARLAALICLPVLVFVFVRRKSKSGNVTAFCATWCSTQAAEPVLLVCV